MTGFVLQGHIFTPKFLYINCLKISSFVGNIENIQVAFKSWSQCSMASKLPWIQIKASCIEQSVSIQTSDVDAV